jgi:hypothetical protein
MKEDDNHKHNDQEPHKYYQDHPPHVHDPIYHLLEGGRIQKEVSQTINSAIVVQNHTLIEKIAVTGEILAGETDLQVASFTVG